MTFTGGPTHMRLTFLRPALVAATAAIVAGAMIAAPHALTASAATGDDGSGGRAVAHRQNFGRAPASAAAKAPTAKLYRLGVNAGEPTLGLTKNGDIFYTAIQSNTRVEVMRS